MSGLIYSYPFMFSTQPCFKERFQRNSFSVSNAESSAGWESLPWSQQVPEPRSRSAVPECSTSAILCCFSSADIRRSKYLSEREPWLLSKYEIQQGAFWNRQADFWHRSIDFLPLLWVNVFTFLWLLTFCRFLQMDVMIDRNKLNCESRRWTREECRAGQERKRWWEHSGSGIRDFSAR